MAKITSPSGSAGRSIAMKHIKTKYQHVCNSLATLNPSALTKRVSQRSGFSASRCNESSRAYQGGHNPEHAHSCTHNDQSENQIWLSIRLKEAASYIQRGGRDSPACSIATSLQSCAAFASSGFAQSRRPYWRAPSAGRDKRREQSAGFQYSEYLAHQPLRVIQFEVLQEMRVY